MRGPRTERRPPSIVDAGPTSTPGEGVGTPAPGGADAGEAAIEAGGNARIRSFDEAKRVLARIYERHRVDLYCGCAFAPDAKRSLRVEHGSCGYAIARDPVRAGRIEWEHVIAASWFGRTFTEWTEGDDRCVDAKGKRFKGRKCAERSPEFSRMEGDLHNLFPVVGEVNALRGDLPMGILDPPDRTPSRHKPTSDVFQFGACKSAVERGVFTPRPEVRGDVARAALYMDLAYPTRRLLDEAHRALFARWSAGDPPDAWERERNRLITEAQGNANPLID